MNFNFVLFDLDGTIFDYHKAEHKALKKLFNHFQISGEFDELRKKYIKINLSTWEEFREHKITAEELKTKRFRLFSEKLNLNIPPHKFSQMYQKFLAEGTDLLAGAMEVLDSLKNVNIKMSLITNGLAQVQNERLNNSPIIEYFADVFISEEIGFAKPHPAIFEHIFEKDDGLEKDKTIIIGDNLYSDIKGGRDFGIKTCWFNPEKEDNFTEIIPDYEIEELRQIPPIVF